MREELNSPGLNKRQKGEQLIVEGKERFLGALEKQLQQLDSLYEQLGYAPNGQAAEQWYRILHTMKGSAPVFGLHSVGRLADTLLKEWEWTQAETAAAMNPELWTQQASASLGSSGTVLHQLKLERDILVREHQLSTQKGLSAKSGHLLENSRILLIDDDPVLRSYLVKRLELDGYIVEDSEDVETAQRLLHECHYDLILLDLMMHPKSGYELFEFLQDDPTLKWLPLIVLSAREDVNDKISCLMLGASDYLTKPFRYEELAARIYSLLNRTKNFEQMAFRDALTGVYNRRYFDHHIELEVQRIERYPAPICIAFIDIDRFKSVNDTYGHSIGDLVLQGLAHLVQQRLRSTDVLARYGGEEFVVLFPNTTGEQAVKLLTGVLMHARTNPIAQHEGRSYSVTFSAGVADYYRGTTIPQWIRVADEAMYAAKEQGRNRVLLGGQSSEAAVAAIQPTPVLKRVLIADDDQILRSIVASRLDALPIIITEVSDGEEAYRFLLQEEVDLCILDGVMPRLDGFSLLQKLHEEPAFQHRSIRVLMLSGRKREDDVAKGLELGADEYMSKPFSLVELEMRVRHLLGLD